MILDPRLKATLLRFQRNELTEHYIYNRLARTVKGKNREIFEHIAKDELDHHDNFSRHTGEAVKPDKLKANFYIFVSKIFGLTFAIKLMEKGENSAHRSYGKYIKQMPELKGIIRDEHTHEHELIHMIDEEKLSYLSSMVLAVNNAIEELTGVVVGFTFALRDTKLIGVTALITGIAATLSMAASEYLSQKSEGDGKNPVKAAVYTGIVYLITVALIVGPYFIFKDYFTALSVSISLVVVIVWIFSLFVAVVKDISFKKSFLEVLAISGIVVAVSYAIGSVIRITFLK